MTLQIRTDVDNFTHLVWSFLPIYPYFAHVSYGLIVANPGLDAWFCWVCRFVCFVGIGSAWWMGAALRRHQQTKEPQTMFYDDERDDTEFNGLHVTLWEYDAPEEITSESEPIFTAEESIVLEEQEGTVALNLMTELASIIGFEALQAFGQHVEETEDGIYCDDEKTFRLHIYCNESLSERLFNLLTGADG